MIDLNPSVTRRYEGCFTSVFCQCAAVCAVTLSLLFATGIHTAVQADAWHTFKARCLDVYEALTPAVVADLSQIKHTDFSDAFSDEAVAFGPTETGDVVVLDPAPLQDGDRMCSVAGKIVDRHEVSGWVATQVQTERYEIERDGAETILLSLEWIEPRLQVTLVLEGPNAGTYTVLETYLES